MTVEAQETGTLHGGRLVARRLRAYGVRKLFRSEEHTSELQSHVNLVCRLLLEKKKKKKKKKQINKKKNKQNKSIKKEKNTIIKKQNIDKSDTGKEYKTHVQ